MDRGPRISPIVARLMAIRAARERADREIEAAKKRRQ